jgi:hypothetical protein
MDTNISGILALIDNDLKWRKIELDNLNNILGRLSDDDQKNIIRKSIILMSYSHFEGFFKSSFIIYTEFLNDLEIPMNKAINVLVVSTLNQAFTVYDDKKHQDSSVDVETKYQNLLDRRVSLIESIDTGRKSDIIKLAAESTVLTKVSKKASIIDTESNLKIEVMTKILLRLGMPHDFNLEKNDYNGLKTQVDKLLGIRNSLSHSGKYPSSYQDADFQKCCDAFDEISKLVIKIIKIALMQKLFLKEEFRV